MQAARFRASWFETRFALLTMRVELGISELRTCNVVDAPWRGPRVLRPGGRPIARAARPRSVGVGRRSARTGLACPARRALWALVGPASWSFSASSPYPPHI